jgi:DNA-binding IclR family transcriptional regulator
MSESIQSVERAVRILKALSGGDGRMGLTEIARSVGLGKSTTHRILSSLCSGGLARVDPKTRQYSLGYGLLQMTASWLNGVEVRTAAIPFLRLLRQQTGETVSLNVRDADVRVTIERFDTSHEVRYVADLGRPLPLHVGAGGKAILAFAPEAEIRRILALADLGERKSQRLVEELREIRRVGWAVSIGERVPGACAVSAPVFNHQGTAVASVSILCLESTLREKAASNFGRLVRENAMSVSHELGWPESIPDGKYCAVSQAVEIALQGGPREDAPTKPTHTTAGRILEKSKGEKP